MNSVESLAAKADGGVVEGHDGMRREIFRRRQIERTHVAIVVCGVESNEIDCVIML